MKSRVVIIGGGVGGVACARRLAAQAGMFDVTVIDRSPEHHFAPSFLWLLNGAREEQQVSRPLNRLTGRGVNFKQAAVTSLDLDSRVVETDGGPISYDELVLAPGVELNFDAVPGLDQAQSFYTKEDALALAGALASFEGERVAIVIPSMPYKCPAAPYEAAFLIDSFLRRRKRPTSVSLHTVEPHPLPVAGPVIGAKVSSMFSRRGIDYRPNRTVTGVNVPAGEITFEDGGESYDMLIAIPPHRAPQFVRDSALAGPAGWVPVNEKTLEAAEHVHAIGDVTVIPLKNGKPLPKAGVFAHEQAHVVADNLIALATADTPGASFSGHGTCFLETGGGKAGVARGKFYAQPDPAVRMYMPSRAGHLAKVLFERKWLKQFS